MKLKFLAAGCAAALLLSVTGCADSSSHEEVTTTAATTTTITTETTAPPDDAWKEYDSTWRKADPELGLPTLDLGKTTDEMVERSIMHVGNRARLANAMKRAKSNLGITVAVIGGSVAQGAGASSSVENYAYYNMMWWMQTFPTDVYKMEFVNAGMGTTGSYVGVHRAASELLAKKPDVVLVDFALHDTDRTRDAKSYHSLIRNILELENNPAVILLFGAQENGQSFADVQKEIGYAYDLPMISYQNAVMPEIAAGHFSWKDIAADTVHPNSAGHGIIGELLWEYYNSVFADLDYIPTVDLSFPENAITENRYADADILSSRKLEAAEDPVGFAEAEISKSFPHNYATETAGEISFTVEAQNIGVLYQRTPDGNNGRYDVYVDGTLMKTLDGNFADGWGSYAEAEEIFTSWAKTQHTVTFKKAADSPADGFQILGIMVSG